SAHRERLTLVKIHHHLQALHQVMQEASLEPSIQRLALVKNLCQVLQEIKTIKPLAHLRAKCAKKCLPTKGPLALTFVRTQCNRILPGWNGYCHKIKMKKTLKILKTTKLMKIFKRNF